MIAAVKVESNALDTMKEKLKEVEGLRNQISHFTRRLLDADQANLNLKANLVKAQELYADMKKSKMELESSMVPLRQELNRSKEMCSKERQARLAAQQQITQMKEQITQLESLSQTLDRDVKSIPALTESNEILKNDLSSLRKRVKEEKGAMQRHIKQLEARARDAEAVRGSVRELSLKLLDVCNSSSSNNNNNNIISNSNSNNNNSNNFNGINSTTNSSMLQQQQQQQQQQRYHQLQQQQSRYSESQSYQQNGSASSGNIYYQTEQPPDDAQQQYDEYEEEEEEYPDDFNRSLLSADQEEYTSGAYLEESSVASHVDSSIDSFRQSKMAAAAPTAGGGNDARKGVGKKKGVVAGGVRRMVGSNSNSNNTQLGKSNHTGNNPRVMQQLHEQSSSYQQSHSASQGFNLPRI
jgi:chromosome segregation ATPase